MLRLIGTDWGKPQGYHYDEHFIVAPALEIVATRDLDPRFYRYPSGMIYAEAAIVATAVALDDKVQLEPPAGPAFGPTDLGPGQWPVLVGGRRLVAVLGAATVVAVALAAAFIAGPLAGFTAGALLAFLPLHVEHSHYLTTDVPAAAFLALALALASSGHRRLTYLGAGALAGAAVAMKYTAAFALPAVALAAWLTHTEGPRRFGLMAACAAFTFLALCPWPLLQPAAFFNDLEAVRAHYSGGHLGAQGTGNWGWYLHKLAENDGLSIAGVCLFAAGGLGTLAGVFRNGRDSRHSRSHLLPFALFLCALLWLAWLGTVKVRFERNMLNAVVPASVAAGCGLAELATALRGRFPPRVGWAAACLALFLLAITAAASLRLSLRLAGDDTRELAAAWISEHVEAGAHIVREAYTPRPDPGRYRVEYSWSLAHHGPAWYRAQGVDYLLASYAVWGRLLDSGSQQSARGNYMDILALPVVADFQPGPRTMGPPLTIHRIDRKNGPSRLR